MPGRRTPSRQKKIAKASKIANIVVDVNDMLDEIDGVLIAGDDYETHYPLAKTFLEKGKFVFIDKPLSLRIEELKFFKKYLDGGRLMSCAGARYAKELDEDRGHIDSFGEMKLIRGTVMNSMEKYGVHMLDGIFGVTELPGQERIMLRGKTHLDEDQKHRQLLDLHRCSGGFVENIAIRFLER